ncbi:uncharacterized protein M6B38_409810 [Iris pallida]|uniref:Acyl-coenzyme A thioesterase 13 n=1 Tax=Iris pallida TaxID=29817 RepID=A0AAX6FNM1_IRIPA|nr:uncharacterized protein M6B38_409810 [Iris pallida]
MDKAIKALSVGEEDWSRVSGLHVRPHRPGDAGSFYEGFALRGIQVDQIRPGSLTCTFKVPPRLTDRNGNLSVGAIANLVDEVGGAATSTEGTHMKVSVDMSISYMSDAKTDDELEISSKVLGNKGGFSGTHVIIKNRKNGEIVAEGRHTLFGNLRSKI